MKRCYAPEREFDVFDDLITPQQAGREFNYSPRTIIMYCDAGYVAAIKFGRQWVLRRSSLISFVRRRENARKVRYTGRDACKRTRPSSLRRCT
jgi:hypothetical protein